MARTSSLQTLKTLRQVEVINFGDCLVRSKGAVAIADAVRGGLPKLKVPSGVAAPPTRGGGGWGVHGGGSRGSVFKGRRAWVLPHSPSVTCRSLHLSELKREAGATWVTVVEYKHAEYLYTAGRDSFTAGVILPSWRTAPVLSWRLQSGT